MEDTAQANATILQKASRMATILSMASSIAINVALPLLLYLALKNYTNASDFLALVISGTLPTIESIVGVISRKRIDLLTGIVLASIVISLILIVLNASKLIMRREFAAEWCLSLVQKGCRYGEAHLREPGQAFENAPWHQPPAAQMNCADAYG
jgi:FlaA1/EpsC-like NDP-sugar epimerase